MNKRILFSVIGVLAGILFGMVFMMSLHMASTVVYPLPDGVDLMSQEPANQERLQEWFAGLSTGAWLLAIASHGLGCMGGAFVAMLISGRRSLVPPLVVGAFFTLGGIMNLASLPHPGWFPFVDLPIYLLLAFVAGRLLQRKDVATT